MLMKLEKDRLVAKVESLEANLSQVTGEHENAGPKGDLSKNDLSQLDIGSPGKSSVSRKSPGRMSSHEGLGGPSKNLKTSANKFSVSHIQPKQTPIPKHDAVNPYA